MTETNSKLEAALSYAALGWAVFPIMPGAKKPPLTPHGFKDASKEPDQIRAWWATTPDANIGVATGAVSGISVLDWDEKEWEDKHGLETLEALTTRHGDLPKTPAQATWSGSGGQAIFAYTPGAPTGTDCYGRWLDGRNDGGYIVVPPSTVVDADREGTYTWLDGQNPFERPLEPMPSWLLDQIKTGAAGKRTAKGEKKGTAATVPQIAAGSRNCALASLAGTMRRRDASEEAVRQALVAQNTAFDEPLPANEVKGIVASAMRNFAPAEVDDRDARWTDKANAERLAQSAGQRIRYCDDLNRWFYFDGVRWVPTSRFGIAPFVTDLAKALYRRTASESDDDKRKRLGEEARKLESARVVRNVIEMAQSLPELRIAPGDFDQDAHLLNVQNGTLDLRTGELLPRDPAHRITKLAPVMYDPDACSTLWEDTIKLVTCGDNALAAFLQCALGYALTGYVSESSFFVFYGPGGSNGKTTILESFAAVLGDYATTLRVQALLAGQDDKIPHDFADLRGARFVVTSELPKGKRYDEATLKLITGGDEVTACHKYGNNFRYYPSFKLFMSTNFPPVFSAGDDALWNRAKTVPFRFSFKTYAQADKTAKDRLKEPEHRAAILAWAMRGCQAWRASGLALPEAVQAETSQHRRDVDVIQAFVDERCALADAQRPETWVSNQELFRGYKAWNREQPVPQPMNATEFSSEMERAGHTRVKPRVNGNHSERWQRLRLKGDHE
jgi:putative DNA primase/helicase